MSEATSEAVMEPKPNGIPTAKELGFDPAALRENMRRSARGACARTGITNTKKLQAPTSTTTSTRMSSRASRARRCKKSSRRLSSAGALAASWRRLGFRRPGSLTFASSKRVATLAGPGTGTAIPAPSATLNPTFTCRCSKRPDIFRRRSTPSRPRFSSTPNGSGSTSTFTGGPASRRRSKRHAGTIKQAAGPSALTEVMSSRRAL